MSYNHKTIEQDYPHYHVWKALLSVTYKKNNALYVPFDQGIRKMDKTSALSISRAAYLWASFMDINGLTPSEEHSKAAGIDTPVVPLTGNTFYTQVIEWLDRCNITMIPIHKMGLVPVDGYLTLEDTADLWCAWVDTMTRNTASDYYDCAAVRRGTFPGHIDHVFTLIRDHYNEIGSSLERDLSRGNAVVALPATYRKDMQDSVLIMGTLYSETVEFFYPGREEKYRVYTYRNVVSRLSVLLRTLHPSIVTVKNTGSNKEESSEKIREALSHDNNVNNHVNKLLQGARNPESLYSLDWLIITMGDTPSSMS